MFQNPCFGAKFIATQAWQWISEQYTILGIFPDLSWILKLIASTNRHDIDRKSIIFLNYQIENQESDRWKSVSDCSERSCLHIRSNWMFWIVKKIFIWHDLLIYQLVLIKHHRITVYKSDFKSDQVWFKTPLKKFKTSKTKNGLV